MFVHFPEPTTARLLPRAGVVTSQDWLDVARLASECGDGTVYLPGPGTFELRCVDDAAALRSSLAGTRLAAMPCAVLPSPLSARARALAAAVAVALSDAAPQLTVAIDDGTGHAVSAHVGAVLLGHDVEIYAGGRPTGRVVAEEDVPAALAALAPEIPAEAGPLAGKQPIGWLPLPDGRVNLGAALAGGAMPAAYAEMIGRMEVTTSLTPWGGIVVHALPEGDADVVLRFLAPRGFVFDARAVPGAQRGA